MKLEGSPCTRDQLADLCREIVAETDVHPPKSDGEQIDVGFLSKGRSPGVSNLVYSYFLPVVIEKS